jgi:hypothetical protein
VHGMMRAVTRINEALGGMLMHIACAWQQGSSTGQSAHTTSLFTAESSAAS